METESLIIPRREPLAQVGRSLALIGMGSLACAGQNPCLLEELLQDRNPSTGSNITWLEKSLPGWERERAGDLYAQTVQSLHDVSSWAAVTRQVHSDRDSLLHVKEVLSLTGQQLAAAMGVSRTALYQWLDESVTMREKSREKLSSLRELADFWESAVGKPLARSLGIGGGERSRLAKLLTGTTVRGFKEARSLLETLAGGAPATEPGHKSVLDIMKERSWSRLPEHVRRSEMETRTRTIESNSDQD